MNFTIKIIFSNIFWRYIYFSILYKQYNQNYPSFIINIKNTYNNNNIKSFKFIHILYLLNVFDLLMSIRINTFQAVIHLISIPYFTKIIIMIHVAPFFHIIYLDIIIHFTNSISIISIISILHILF